MTAIKPDKDCSELFDILARHGIERVVVSFNGGWDYNECEKITEFKDGKEVDVEEVINENEELVGKIQCYHDFHNFDEHYRVWRDIANTMSWGYDEYRRYDRGNYYNGVENGDGEVIFDVAKREIRLEAKAKVCVVEYRYDDVSRAFVVQDDGSLTTILEEAAAE